MSNANFSNSIQNTIVNNGAKYKGTNHMGKTLAYEPQRLYNFELQIVGLDSLFTANNQGTQGDNSNNTDNLVKFGNAGERILCACSSFSVPDTTIGSIEIPHYNNTTKYAGKVSFGDATLVIEQFLGSYTEQIMMAWAACVYDPVSQNIGFKADYAKDVYVIQYDSKGGSPRIWKMENAWPKSIPGANWSYDGESRRQLSYTLACDRCIPDYGIDWRTFDSVSNNDSIYNKTLTNINTNSKEFQTNYNNGWVYDVSNNTYKNPNTNEIR